MQKDNLTQKIKHDKFCDENFDDLPCLEFPGSSLSKRSTHKDKKYPTETTTKSSLIDSEELMKSASKGKLLKPSFTENL
jgi:hypothetical protein